MPPLLKRPYALTSIILLWLIQGLCYTLSAEPGFFEGGNRLKRQFTYVNRQTGSPLTNSKGRKLVVLVTLVYQRCTISIFCYQFNINYSVCRLININANINYFKGGLSISIPYQFFQKFPYQFQYQFMLSISPYDIVNITNCLSISHCYQYQYWYQLMKKGHININSISIIKKILFSMSISISILPFILINISLLMHCAPLSFTLSG